MALVLTEPFDVLTAWSANGTIVAGGRRGTGLQTTAGQNANYTIAGGSQTDTVTVGFAVSVASVTSTPSVVTIRADGAGTAHVTVRVMADGSLWVYRGTASGTLLVSGPSGSVINNTWCYIELQTKLHDTTGFAIVRADGVVVASISNTDTKNIGAAAVFDTVQLSAPANSVTTLYDDVYVRNDALFQGDPTGGSLRSARHTLRAAFDDVPPRDWYRNVRHTVRVAFNESGVENVGPTAAFSSSVAGLTATFTDASTDPDGTIVSRDWNFGDGTAHSTATNPAHTYVAGGSYTVSLTVTDNSGAISTVTHPVTLATPNVPPTAEFTHSVSELLATFTNTSTDPDGTIATYAWTFGDGATSTAANPTHTYATAGAKTVTLTVTDDDGASDSVTHTVTVTAPPPGNCTNFTQIGTSTSLDFIDTNLIDEAVYRYRVIAVDAAGNRSAPSNIAMATAEVPPATSRWDEAQWDDGKWQPS